VRRHFEEERWLEAHAFALLAGDAKPTALPVDHGGSIGSWMRALCELYAWRSSVEPALGQLDLDLPCLSLLRRSLAHQILQKLVARARNTPDSCDWLSGQSPSSRMSFHPNLRATSTIDRLGGRPQPSLAAFACSFGFGAERRDTEVPLKCMGERPVTRLNALLNALSDV